MNDDSKVLVCDRCMTAACWYGEHMCQHAVGAGAGLVVRTVADLKDLNLEHQDNWSDAKMIEVYGNADRNFDTGPG